MPLPSKKRSLEENNSEERSSKRRSLGEKSSEKTSPKKRNLEKDSEEKSSKKRSKEKNSKEKSSKKRTLEDNSSHEGIAKKRRISEKSEQQNACEKANCETIAPKTENDSLTVITFPQDTIKKIFVFAADSSEEEHPLEMARLLSLVCKDAANWMRPIIWRTVHLTHTAQAINVYRSFFSSTATPPPTSFVCDLWIRSDYMSAFTTARPLRWPCKRIANRLVEEKRIHNLAIDVTLLSEGWLIDAGVRPKHVFLLDSQDPCKPYDFDYSHKIFSKTTHLIVGPHWHKVAPMLPEQNPLLHFPALKHLCVQLPAGMDVDYAVCLVRRLARFWRLTELIVCIDSGFNAPVCENNPLWEALKKVAREARQVLVTILPRMPVMWREWRRLVDGGRTVWERATDPEEREPLPAMEQKEEDWSKLLGVAAVTNEDQYGNQFLCASVLGDSSEPLGHLDIFQPMPLEELMRPTYP